MYALNNGAAKSVKPKLIERKENQTNPRSWRFLSTIDETTGQRNKQGYRAQQRHQSTGSNKYFV